MKWHIYTVSGVYNVDKMGVNGVMAQYTPWYGTTCPVSGVRLFHFTMLSVKHVTQVFIKIDSFQIYKNVAKMYGY